MSMKIMSDSGTFKRSLIRALLVVAVAFTACNLPDQGGGDIDVDAGAGANPAYYWDGGVCSLTVARTASTGHIVWGVTTPNRDDLLSPYFQGQVKTGVTRIANAESTLVCGVQYRVRVVTTDGTEGWTDFTPASTSGGG
jgi:hypothetical protein